MSENAEAGIAQVQARAAQSQGASGLNNVHEGTVSYLNERIVTFALVVAMIGLMILWATAKSALLLYGSLAGVILLAVVWGILRVKRLEALKLARAQQAENWQSGDG